MVKAKEAEEDDAAGQELAIGDHTVGSTVYVKGKAGGAEGWFQAEILSLRTRYPPIQVKYVADLHGKTLALALPAPLVAAVALSQIRSDKPSPPQKRGRYR